MVGRWMQCPCHINLTLEMLLDFLIKGHFAVSTVPADGLAPWGARASACTMMTKSVPRIYIRPVLEGLRRYDISNSQLYFSHVSSHYLNQSWYTVFCYLMNKFQGNLEEQKALLSEKNIWKYLQNIGHFSQASNTWINCSESPTFKSF